jgi:hypothetical protein
MKAWLGKLFAPAAVGAAIGGVATFFGTEAVKLYYFERNEVSGQVKEARAVIDPFLHPLPLTVRESRDRIIGLRGKRLLFQSQEAKNLFALAIGHLDEYQDSLRAKEVAEAEQRRRRAKLAAAKRRNDAAAIKRAERAAREQAKKVNAAKKAASAVSKAISKISIFKPRKR